MRLLKWLFQPAYLLLIIVLVALYVNREAIFPEEVVESLEAEALVAKVEDLAERLSSQHEESGSTLTEQGEGAQEDASRSVGAASVVESPVALEERPVELQQGPVVVEEPSITGAEELSTAMTEEAEASDAAALPQPEEEPALASSEAHDMEEPAPVAELPAVPVEGVMAAEVTNDVAEEGVATQRQTAPMEPVASSDGGEPPQVELQSPLAAWRDARAAVWQGDLDSAVAQYRAVVAMQPENFDAYGEMGNVLLAQSDVAAAVEAYATAARLIRQAGNPEMAWRVAGIVAQLDEEQGRNLYDEFSR